MSLRCSAPPPSSLLLHRIHLPTLKAVHPSCRQRLLRLELMPVTARIVALSAVAVAVCCGSLLFAASVPVQLLEASSHSVVAGKVNRRFTHACTLALMLL